MYTIMIWSDFSLSNNLLQNTIAPCGNFGSVDEAVKALEKNRWKRIVESNNLRWTQGTSFRALITPINDLDYLRVSGE